MAEQPTCGRGLAEHSALPAKLADVIESLAVNLERHIPTLDLTDENSRMERDIYRHLAAEHRAIADQLRATAARMASYRDLPMGRHNEKALADPQLIEAFRAYVDAEQELHTLLAASLQRDRGMLSKFES
jgi:hypothetical protein